MNIEFWRLRSEFKLSEAALLLAGHDPDVFSDEMLLTKPPSNFKAIYGQMIIDAETDIGFPIESDEYPGEYYIPYSLQTHETKNLKGMAEKELLAVRISAQELTNWTEKKGISLGLLDGTPRHTPSSTKQLGDRERENNHRIIAALMMTILDSNLVFKTQEELIGYLVPEFKGYDGLSKSNLENIFASGRKLIENPSP